MFDKILPRSQKGMTLVEVIVALTVFAIGVLGLSRVMFRAMHANMNSKHTVVATNLAHEKMEEVIGSIRYSAINSTNFPSEDFEQVNVADPEYRIFKRTVAISDSLNAVGNSVMKEITVRVEWRQADRVRNVELKSSISRFKDINL
ncbi:MAG: prepilin-type N-terminal cleavage/methylation domain-containing protein [Candidatus Krumholzibacteriota bacterium]|nr:prepilin-type N-terminal cleavage/methylation domain-containing protein [Candidatus Krumholzibacteriota bacterium]